MYTQHSKIMPMFSIKLVWTDVAYKKETVTLPGHLVSPRGICVLWGSQLFLLELLLSALSLSIFKLYNSTSSMFMVGLLVVLRINVDLAIFQPYLDLKGGENQSLKI